MELSEVKFDTWYYDESDDYLCWSDELPSSQSLFDKRFVWPTKDFETNKNLVSFIIREASLLEIEYFQLNNESIYL